jgi:pilus assembly protein CpaE
MAENKMTVALDVKSQPVVRDLTAVISETEGFQLKNLNGSGPYDVLILEIGDDPERDFSLIRSIQAAGTAKALFLTSSRLEPEVLIRALRTGAKEFLPQPIQKEDLTRALLRYQEHRLNEVSATEKHRQGRIIHVMGGKGGVGTTTVAVNLSTSLAEANPTQSVALIDMNLLFGEIPIFLDLQSDFDWGEVVKDVGRVDTTFLKSILVKHASGTLVHDQTVPLGSQSVACRAVFRPPQVPVRCTTSMAPVCEFRRNSRSSRPDTSRAFATVPSGRRTLEPAVT